MKYTDILSKSIVFKSVLPETIEELFSNANFQYRTFNKGDIIAHSGTPCDHIRIVVKGRVSGEMMDISGKVLKIEDLLPSKLIAPAFLYGKRRKYPVNVISMESTVIWQIHREEFSKLLQQNITILDNFLSAISSRAQFLSEKIKFVSFPSIRAKIASFILHYSEGQDVLQLPITHQQMSELFGVTRPSLSREFRNMNTEGLIDSERDVIHILDRKRLGSFLQE